MPLFAHTTGNELYVLLIEKAMAKLGGSYAKLCGGSPSQAFIALTGCTDCDVWMRHEGPVPVDESLEDPLWFMQGSEDDDGQDDDAAMAAEPSLPTEFHWERSRQPPLFSDEAGDAWSPAMVSGASSQAAVQRWAGARSSVGQSLGDLKPQHVRRGSLMRRRSIENMGGEPIEVQVEVCDDEPFFDILVHHSKQRHIMSASTLPRAVGEPTAVMTNGLVAGHAYAILRLVAAHTTNECSERSEPAFPSPPSSPSARSTLSSEGSARFSEIKMVLRAPLPPLPDSNRRQRQGDDDPTPPP
eukprot:255404-Prymnesium_polylepis.1